ncbi:TIGR03084 family metal-binding protein [Actinomycetospora sp. C-140]
MAVDMTALLADLQAETDVVLALVEPLDDDGVGAATPAEGWSIRDQLTHLAYFDETATLAAADPDRFRRESAELRELGDDFPDQVAAQHAHLPAAAVRDWLVRARAGYIAVFSGLDPSTRLPWYGPDMSAASSATARLMETWAHGQDIADALGAVREPTDRLRHIAHLGVRTAGFAFALRGRPVPEAPVRVALDAPSGDRWTWGPEDAADRVEGTALDFCLAVTQRRHRDDTGLRVTGPVATEWMSIAQAFAGAPADGRAPSTRDGSPA